MNVRRAALVLALSALLGCSREPYSRSSSGLSALDKKVLYDFRNPTVAPKPELTATIERQVLSAVSRNYYTRAGDCPRHHKRDVVVHVAGAAEGSFSALGAKETVYLVDVAACDAGAAPSANQLLVFGGSGVTASAQVPESRILGVYDLDGDGINELLLATGSVREGDTNSSVRLVRFDKKAFITIEDFGRVYDSDCRAFDSAGAAGRTQPAEMKNDSGGIIETAVISYLPVKGQLPKFVMARYRAPCPAAGQVPQWTRVGEQ